MFPKKFTPKILARYGLITGLYVALTWALPEFSYGVVQFRISEILNLLAFYNPIYVIPITLGCGIANLFSPFGIIDVIVGSAHTFVSLYCMTKVKKDIIAALFPALFSFMIGLEMMFLSDTSLNFFLITGQVMLSELVIVGLISVPFYRILSRNHEVMRILSEK